MSRTKDEIDMEVLDLAQVLMFEISEDGREPLKRLFAIIRELQADLVELEREKCP